MNIETFFNSDNESRFYFPGRIFMGRNIAERAVDILSGQTSLAVVVDQAVSGLDLIAKIQATVPPGVMNTWVINGPPFVQDVEKFIGQMQHVPSAIVSIGGGSASDFAKAVILHELFGRIDGVGVGALRGVKPRPDSRRPLYIAIPTTAGSGAEASRYYVTYDNETHGKVFGKTWAVVADWILLDPGFLATMPSPVLVGCAFDAFVHLFESLIARHERSMFGEMLSLDGIPRIMGALEAVLADSGKERWAHEQLMYSATMAGVAISNVRTGHIHEAAGALLELTTLSHSETLFVFFRDAVERYAEAIRDQEYKLLHRLHINPAFRDLHSIGDIVRWWETVFSRVGLDKKIRSALIAITPSLREARRHIFERVYSDKVWINKECPVPLDDRSVESFIAHSLARFGVDLQEGKNASLPLRATGIHLAERDSK